MSNMEVPQQQNMAKMMPAPPKKPLTPYMSFSKSKWHSVKEVNPSMSVCEVGAEIGKMWRELQDEQKQVLNEEYAAAKLRYNETLAEYLRTTGLKASDLSKPRKKNR